MKPAVFIAVMAAAAGAAWGQPQEGRARPTVKTPDCTTAECHTKELNHKFQHGPTAVAACDACHQYADPAAHTFKLRAEGRELCTFCHINKGGTSDPVAHKPFADGECLKCHDPHGSEARFNLRKEDTNSLCLSCHAAVLENHTSVHKAVTEKNCTACHQAHSSEHKRLLVKETRELCLSCHEDVAHQVQTAVSFHDPMKPGNSDCLQCHTPHASDTSHQLKAPPAELCGKCHLEIAKTAMNASNPHSAVLEGEACLNCHKPHGSEHAKLMKGAPVETCLACHKEGPKTIASKKEENPARPVFVDLAAPTAPTTPPGKPKLIAKGVPELSTKGLNPHGPVAEGKCAACHDVHGGSNANLLKAAFSTEFYQKFAPENYALCFTCHDQKLAESAKTGDATNFRDGERNLHYLHLNKEQGRSCIACHTVHASKFEKQICDSVTFGQWQLPINYKPSETGGSCAPGCHRVQTYTRTAATIPVKGGEKLGPPVGGEQPK
jgi:predicted CXXCH cytochrome family protein